MAYMAILAMHKVEFGAKMTLDFLLRQRILGVIQADVAANLEGMAEIVASLVVVQANREL